MHARGVVGSLSDLLTIILTLIAAEALVRRIDCLPILAWNLPAVPAAVRPSSRDTADEKYLGMVRLAAGVDAAWYHHDPAPHAAAPLPDTLASRYDRYKSVDLAPAFRVWNRVALHEQLCDPGTAPAYAAYDFFVFDPPTATPYPPYRHLPGVAVPGWFPANRFGWRGPDLTLNKPAGTIRIAFLGSSKTMDPYANRFSHIEYIGEWLNLWMQARGHPYHVEVSNAARIGVSERSSPPILLSEVLPLEPDLVIDDGNNDFGPILLIQTAHDPPAKPGPLYTPGGTWAADAHFALSRRLHTLSIRIRRLDGSEPRKPVPQIKWPTDIDEFHRTR